MDGALAILQLKKNNSQLFYSLGKIYSVHADIYMNRQSRAMKTKQYITKSKAGLASKVLDLNCLKHIYYKEFTQRTNETPSHCFFAFWQVVFIIIL